jgi:hypothetical protein
LIAFLVLSFPYLLIASVFHIASRAFSTFRFSLFLYRHCSKGAGIEAWPGDWLSGRGGVYFRRKQYRLALADCEAAIRSNPPSPRLT